MAGFNKPTNLWRGLISATSNTALASTIIQANATVTTCIKSITLNNPGGANILVHIAAGGVEILTLTVSAKGYAVISSNEVLDPGDSLQMWAQTANVVYTSINGVTCT